MIAWPSNLPAPVNDPTITPGDTCKRRKLMSGRVEVRRFGDGAPDQLAVVFRFVDDERESFDDWFHWELNLGANWFTADWLEIFGYTEHAARFLGYPRVAGKSPRHWDVSATLLVQKTAWVAVGDTLWQSMRAD
jgi:hypothetical protein